jgi:hypothetical protein
MDQLPLGWIYAGATAEEGTAEKDQATHNHVFIQGQLQEQEHIGQKI